MQVYEKNRISASDAFMLYSSLRWPLALALAVVGGSPLQWM